MMDTQNKVDLVMTIEKSAQDSVSDEDLETCTPPEIKETASQLTEKLIPIKSREIYKHWMEVFDSWRSEKKLDEYISENVFLAFFGELSTKYAPSSLWTIHSCLKKILLIEKGVRIEGFKKVEGFLKNLSKNHLCKKAMSFSRDEVERFLKTAPDSEFLLKKIIMLIGLAGGMRSEELTNLTFDDIKICNEGLRVNIKESKTDQAGNGFEFFVLSSKDEWENPVIYFEKYKSQVGFCEGRVFRQIRNGKMVKQPCGRSFFLAAPKKIAWFFELKRSESYTGHSIRRTAATWLANQGSTTIDVKKFGRWCSDTVAAGYVDRGDSMKRRFANMIATGDSSNSNEGNILIKGEDQKKVRIENNDGIQLNEDSQDSENKKVGRKNKKYILKGFKMSSGTINININKFRKNS